MGKQLNSTAVLKLVLLMGVVAWATASSVLAAEEDFAVARLEHAKELLGKKYQKKVTRVSVAGPVSAAEEVSEISSFVREATKKFLPKDFKKSARKVSTAILDASKKFDLDPVFVMAVILNESSFRPKLKGGAGEIGLMQIKPNTAAWIAKTYKLKYKNANSLYDPSTNIWLGAAYMSKLREQFESHSQLYLSAYNIGAKKVRQMVSEDRKPKEYVQAVMKRYMALYAGYRLEGSAEKQSEMAWMKTSDITKKN